MRSSLLTASLMISTLLPSGSASPLPAGNAAKTGLSVEGLGRMHALIEGYVERGEMAGLVTLIARDGKIVDLRTYGFRDLEARLPMERDTLFRMASMTKMVTAVAVLTLYDDEKIGLDDPVSKYLPAFEQMRVVTGGDEAHPKSETARPITIRHLLTHTSGIAVGGPHAEILKTRYGHALVPDYPVLKDLVKEISQLELCNQPGDAIHYGGGFEVLGYLVEVVSGRPFDAYVRERVTGPLGMNDTFFQVPKEKQPRLAQTYVHEGKKLSRRNSSTLPYYLGGVGCPRGSSGLVSTADDFARFGQMLLNGGELGGVRILRAKTVQMMTSDQLATLKEKNTFQQPFESYGFGVSVRLPVSDAPPGSPGQFGWSGAWTTYCSMNPKERTISILLSQHAPWNEDDIFAKFEAASYRAVEAKK